MHNEENEIDRLKSIIGMLESVMIDFKSRKDKSLVKCVINEIKQKISELEENEQR